MVSDPWEGLLEAQSHFCHNNGSEWEWWCPRHGLEPGLDRLRKGCVTKGQFYVRCGSGRMLDVCVYANPFAKGCLKIKCFGNFQKIEIAVLWECFDLGRWTHEYTRLWKGQPSRISESDNFLEHPVSVTRCRDTNTVVWHRARPQLGVSRLHLYILACVVRRSVSICGIMTRSPC